MTDRLPADLSIAVLIPCFNEERTIAGVVSGFRLALPLARIYVYDNNSTDRTALYAALAGATVVKETRQGKGHVVRRMFSDIDADIYIMADGDGTYPAEDAPELALALISERADMVVATRRGVTSDAGRAGHAFGNRIFNMLYQSLFGRDFTDIFSGYRAFSRRFAKSFPALSAGFEIETEMSVHASQLKMPVAELPVEYGRRPLGSASKLSTFRDGRKILTMFAMLMKETRPFAFFGYIGVAALILSGLLAAPVVLAYLQTGLVERMPTWVLSVALLITAMMFFVSAIILDSVARGRAEQKRMHYMTLAPLRRDVLVARAGGELSAPAKRVMKTKQDKAAA